MYDLFFITGITYKTPVEIGHCGIEFSNDTHTISGRHELCLCGVTDYCTTKICLNLRCKSTCDEDQNCKGYSIRSTDERNDLNDLCFIYTTSSCPTNCPKFNVGFVGDLVDLEPIVPDPNNLSSSESGCFMKKDGKF